MAFEIAPPRYLLLLTSAQIEEHFVFFYTILGKPNNQRSLGNLQKKSYKEKLV